MINRFRIILVMFTCSLLCISFKTDLYAKSEGRNPFIPQLPGEKRIELEEEAKDVPRPTISIQGLVWQTSMPQAIINNHVVKIGDFISGDMRIIDISKEGIVIEYQGHTFFYSSTSLTPMRK